MYQQSLLHTIYTNILHTHTHTQGFLQQVEGEVKLLRGELDKRDDTIRTLSSSLATLTSRLEVVEKSSSVESDRIG